MIGVYIQETEATRMVDAIRAADAAGVPAFWLTVGGTAPDAAMVFAAAAMVTENIKLGTSIIPTWPHHPVALAQQALTMASLAPGRFRLGIGTSHDATMEATFGIEYKRPLLQLREYLTVLTELLRNGEVEFDGQFAKTKAKLAGPVDVPVMASALRPASFRLCGELADGAISWVAPWAYLRDIALPALQDGAASAGRTPPPLIAHVPVFLGSNKEEMLERSRGMIGRYGRLPNYRGMMDAAGFAASADGDVDPFLEALVIWGSDDTVASGLRQILNEGAGEIIVHPIFSSGDRDAYNQRLFEVISQANRLAGVTS